MTLKLSIIIVNWNGEKFLPACLRSIVENQPAVPFEIIVADNASSDGSVDWLKREQAGRSILKDTDFSLIESRENLGFGWANNLALEKTRAPYVFFLNPDTIVRPGAIETLLETLDSDENVGAAAPRLLNEDGTLQPSVWGFPPTAVKFLFEGLKLYKFLPANIHAEWLSFRRWPYDQKFTAQVVMGAAIMAKRRMLDKIGGFDPKYYMYGEDTELCLRISQSDWRIIFEPAAEVIHLGGQSAVQRWDNQTIRLKEEEAFLNFQMDFLSPAQVMRNTAARIFLLFLYYVKNSAQGKDWNIYKPLFEMQKRGFIESYKKLFKAQASESKENIQPEPK